MSDKNLNRTEKLLLEKETLSILNKIKDDKIKPKNALRELLVLFGVNKTSLCALDRLPNECSIYINTKLKCGSCGHFHGNHIF